MHGDEGHVSPTIAPWCCNTLGIGLRWMLQHQYIGPEPWQWYHRTSTIADISDCCFPKDHNYGVMHGVEGHMSPIIALLCCNTLGISPILMFRHNYSGSELWQWHYRLQPLPISDFCIARAHSQGSDAWC